MKWRLHHVSVMRRPRWELINNGDRLKFQTWEDSGLFWNILVTPINLLGRKRHIECGTMTAEGGLGFHSQLSGTSECIHQAMSELGFTHLWGLCTHLIMHSLQRTTLTLQPQHRRTHSTLDKSILMRWSVHMCLDLILLFSCACNYM